MENFDVIDNSDNFNRSVNDSKVMIGTNAGVSLGQEYEQSNKKAQAGLFAAAIASAHPDEKTKGNVTTECSGIKMSLSKAKGAICYVLDEEESNPGFASFVPIAASLVRGIGKDELNIFVKTMMQFVKLDPIRNLSLVLQFLTYVRSIRAYDEDGCPIPCPGKGERSIYFIMIQQLWTEHILKSGETFESFQDPFVKTVYHISLHYGCILDVIKLFQISEKSFQNKLIDLLIQDVKPYIQHWVDNGMPVAPKQTETDNEQAKSLAKEQINMIEMKFDGTLKIKWQLLFKWLPREKSKYSLVAKHLQKKLKLKKQEYRKCVSYFTWLSGIVERVMSGKRYDEINHPSVPSGALVKYRMAFQNKIRGELMTESIRYPNDLKRQKCAENFYKCVEEGSLNLGQLDILQLIRLINTGEIAMANLSAKQIVQAIEKDALKLCDGDEEKANEQLLMLPICDLSGSMMSPASGAGENIMCRDIAIALSVLVSMTTSVLKNLVLVFAEKACWVAFEPNMPFVKRYEKLKASYCGLTTNFHICIEAVLNTMKELNIPSSRFPKLVVFTDMRYNDHQIGGGMTQTLYTHFMDMLTEHSKEVCKLIGEQFDEKAHVKNLQIAHCNLRAQRAELSTSTVAKGTQYICGFNKNLINEIIVGRVEAVKKNVETNPEDSLRASLDVFDSVGKYFMNLVND